MTSLDSLLFAGTSPVRFDTTIERILVPLTLDDCSGIRTSCAVAQTSGSARKYHCRPDASNWVRDGRAARNSNSRGSWAAPILVTVPEPCPSIFEHTPGRALKTASHHCPGLLYGADSRLSAYCASLSSSGCVLRLSRAVTVSSHIHLRLSFGDIKLTSCDKFQNTDWHPGSSWPGAPRNGPLAVPARGNEGTFAQVVATPQTGFAGAAEVEGPLAATAGRATHRWRQGADRHRPCRTADGRSKCMQSASTCRHPRPTRAPWRSRPVRRP